MKPPHFLKPINTLIINRYTIIKKQLSLLNAKRNRGVNASLISSQITQNARFSETKPLFKPVRFNPIQFVHSGNNVYIVHSDLQCIIANHSLETFDS